jgi:hypothetical protein
MDEIVRPPHEVWDDDAWKKVIASVVQYTVLGDERLEDVIAGGWLLGQRRAKILSREFQVAQDVPNGLVPWCWYPIKWEIFQGSWEYVFPRRWNIFRGASDNPEGFEKRTNEVVPDAVLRLDYHQLMGLLQTVHIRHILSLDDFDSDMARSEVAPGRRSR